MNACLAKLCSIDGSAAFISPQALRVGLLQLFQTSAALWQLHYSAKVAMPMFKIVRASICLPLIAWFNPYLICRPNLLGILQTTSITASPLAAGLIKQVTSEGRLIQLARTNATISADTDPFLSVGLSGS